MLITAHSLLDVFFGHRQFDTELQDRIIQSAGDVQTGVHRYRSPVDADRGYLIAEKVSQVGCYMVFGSDIQYRISGIAVPDDGTTATYTELAAYHIGQREA